MSSNFLDLTQLKKGGLFHIFSSSRGSTGFSLGCLAASPNQTDSSNPHPTLLWISDEGYLYPSALSTQLDIALSKWLFIKPQDSKETWRVTLEATQTGLFEWIFIRPSQGCEVAHLRRLQLAAEKNSTRVVFLGKSKLPHWAFKFSWNVDEDGNEKGSLYRKFKVSPRIGRSVSVSYPQDKSVWRERAIS